MRGEAPCSSRPKLPDLWLNTRIHGPFVKKAVAGGQAVWLEGGSVPQALHFLWKNCEIIMIMIIIAAITMRVMMMMRL